MKIGIHIVVKPRVVWGVLVVYVMCIAQVYAFLEVGIS